MKRHLYGCIRFGTLAIFGIDELQPERPLTTIGFGTLAIFGIDEL